MIRRLALLPLLMLPLLSLALLQASPAVETAAADSEAADAAAGRIRSLLRLDRWSEAVAAGRDYVGRGGDDPRAIAAWAEALIRAGEPAEAAVLLAELVESPDAPGRSFMSLGRLRQARGRIAEALDLRQRALESASEDRDVLFWASELAATRAESVRLLQEFLDRSEGAEEERVESARSAIDVYRALGEREVWKIRHQPEQLEIPLRRIWDDGGQVLGFVLLVRLGPKKKPARLLLDTGSNGVFLVDRVARKRGFEPLGDETIFGGGGDKRHTTSRGLFPRFQIGDLVFEDALASTTPDDLEPQGRFHGVIGISVFDGYRMTLDLRQEKLILDRGGDPEDGEQPYWMMSGQMLVRGAAADGTEGMFLFDTGAGGTFLSRNFADRLSGIEWGGPVAVRTFGGLVEGVLVRGVSLRFSGAVTGRSSLGAVDLSLRSRLGRVEVSGYLGLDVWTGRRIVVDTARRTVTVGPRRP